MQGFPTFCFLRTTSGYHFPCTCVIDLPTRISDHSKTLIDHIYVNDDKHSYVSGAVLSDLSDHYGTFIVALVKKQFQETPKYFNFRDMSTFKIEVFLQNWENDLSEGKFNYNDNVNDQFGKFLAIFCKCVNYSAPLRKASRKEKNYVKNHGYRLAGSNQ